MKKILALDQGEHLGGAERFLSDLLVHLSGDFEIHLITGKNALYQQKYKHSSVILHELELPSLRPIHFRNYKRYRATQKEIDRLIDQIQPDRILSNTVRTHFFVSELAKKKSIPLLWFVHDRTFPRFFIRWFKSYPQTIVFCSQFVQRYYQKALGKVEGLKCYLIYPFGIHPEQLKAFDFSNKKKVIGMVGKFIPWKGQDIFLNMAQKIHKLYPDYRFEMIGGPYENNSASLHFYQKCQKTIRSLGLEKVLKIKEDVPDIFSHLAEWDILVHCSREPEPLGRVILEGLACKCAVVASSLGGPKEVLHHQKTGLIATPEVKSVLKAVREYLDHPQLMERITQEAKKEVDQKYLWPKVIEQFKMILK